MADPIKSRKYPGRHRVVSRQVAADMRFDQLRIERYDKFPCTNPFVMHMVGLPSMFDPD